MGSECARILALLMTAVVGSGLSGCRTVPDGVSTPTAPWEVGEVSILRMQQGEAGPILGEWLMRVEAPTEGDGWVLVTSMSLPQASYLLNTSVQVTRDELRPLRGSRLRMSVK